MRVKTPGMKADSESTTVAVSWPDIMLTPRNCQGVCVGVNNVRRRGAESGIHVYRTHPKPILRADVSLQGGVAFFPDSQVVIFTRQDIGLCSIPAQCRTITHHQSVSLSSWKTDIRASFGEAAHS